MKKKLTQKQIKEIQEQIYKYTCTIEVKADELGQYYVEVHHTDDKGRIIYKEFWKLSDDNTIKFASRIDPTEKYTDDEKWNIQHYRDMFYKKNEECRQLVKHNEELETQVKRLESKLSKIKNQEPIQPVKKHNERGAGRRRLDDKQLNLLEQFAKFKDAGLTRTEIQERMEISDATYYRYQKLISDNKIMV